MDNRRLNRAASLIRGEICAILKELKDPRIKFVTVTGVDLSVDLRHAKVYVSVLGSASEREDTLAGLNSANGFIRKELGTRLTIRYVPELAFLYDDSIEHGIRIGELLDSIG
jgi:ribosome-binding factor A